MVLIIFVELSSGSPQRGKEESRSYWGSTNSVHGYPGNTLICFVQLAI